MMKYLLIALGGAIGTVFRYVVSGLDYRFSNGVLPVGTMAVNVSGSLVIGFLWGLFERFTFSPNTRLFLFMGVMGGYTTFSTFSLETFNLMRDGEYRIALLNIVLSVILSVGVVFIGYFASKYVLNVLD